MGRITVGMDHLEIKVRLAKGADYVSDLKAISGGERSFVTAAFITALGKCVGATFYCLDEVRNRLTASCE